MNEFLNDAFKDYSEYKYFNNFGQIVLKNGRLKTFWNDLSYSEQLNYLKSKTDNHWKQFRQWGNYLDLIENSKYKTQLKLALL